MKTLLVPVDFSDVTGQVISTAASLATALDAKVILTHIAEPEPQFVTYDPGPPSVREAVAMDMHVEHRRLENLKTHFGSTQVLALQLQGSTPEKILTLAREHQADFIIIGSHGHGPLYHLFAGSVTNAILRDAPCPVLVVPLARAAE